MKKNSKKGKKSPLLKSTIFSYVVAAATVMIFVDTAFLVAMSRLLLSPDYENLSRYIVGPMWIVSLFNMVVLLFLVSLRKSYERRVEKRIVLPLRRIKLLLSNLAKGYYDDEISFEDENEIGDLFNTLDDVRMQLAEYRMIEEEMALKKQIHISGLMHDIATPVTRINGFASMILDGLVTDPQDIERFASMILQNTEDINLMLKSLAAAHKYDDTELHLQKQPVDIAAVLDIYLRDLSLELASQGVSISFTNNCQKPTVSILDVKSCKRALMNFVNNSIKYKKADVDCKLDIRLEDYDDTSFLFVFSDNGIGVDPGTEHQIFEMFYRGDSARRNISEGNGLGLYVSKTILLANGAKVWAENNSNGGLSIFVLFKRTESEPIKWYE